MIATWTLLQKTSSIGRSKIAQKCSVVTSVRIVGATRRRPKTDGPSRERTEKEQSEERKNEKRYSILSTLCVFMFDHNKNGPRWAGKLEMRPSYRTSCLCCFCDALHWPLVSFSAVCFLAVVYCTMFNWSQFQLDLCFTWERVRNRLVWKNTVMMIILCLVSWFVLEIGTIGEKETNLYIAQNLKKLFRWRRRSGFLGSRRRRFARLFRRLEHDRWNVHVEQHSVFPFHFESAPGKVWWCDIDYDYLAYHMCPPFVCFNSNVLLNWNAGVATFSSGCFPTTPCPCIWFILLSEYTFSVLSRRITPCSGFLFSIRITYRHMCCCCPATTLAPR